MISANSRYANSTIVTETINGKDIQYITPSYPVSYSFQYSYYVTTLADRVDTLATAFISDPTQWFMIGLANPQIMNFLELPAGTIVRIPTVPVAT